MLKSIEKIKRLGVYSDYVKPQGMEDFGIKNLIYGWNYSGKTTLCRLFSLLETKTEIRIWLGVNPHSLPTANR